MNRWVPALGVCFGFALGLSQNAKGDATSAPQRAPANQQDLTIAAFPAELGEAQLHNKLQSVGQELQQLERRIHLRGRSYVRLIRLGLLPVSEGFSGFVDHAQRAELMRRLLAKDIARQAELTRQSQALNAALGSWRQRQAQSLDRLSGYRRSQEAILAAREREAAFLRAFDGQKSDHTTVYGSVGTGPLPDRFSDARGRLTFPVEGRTRVRQVPSGDEMGPGLKFQVESGNLPRAVYRGKVILVGDYGDLGRAVVLDHGGGYSTLTANLKKVFVEAGASVAAGTPLGELREKDGESELYFELRKDGHPTPPAEWFGL